MFKFLRESYLIVGLLLFSSMASATEIVTHPANSLSGITQAQLRAIFSLQMTHWSDGTPVVVLRLSATNPAHKAFCQDKLRILPQQLEAVWERLVFTGQGSRPLVMKDEKEMAATIASMPGAIGYIAGSNDHVVKIKTLPVLP